MAKKIDAKKMRAAKKKLDALPVPKPHAVKVLTAPKKDDAADWTDAGDQLKKDTKSFEAEMFADSAKRREKAKIAHKSSAVPVESHLPGVARNPKPKKVHQPLAAPLGGLGVEALAQLEIVSYHFLKLMERLAAEQGGPHAQALEDLKADIARRRKP